MGYRLVNGNAFSAVYQKGHANLLLRSPGYLAGQRFRSGSSYKLKAIWHSEAAHGLDCGPFVRDPPHDAVYAGLPIVENNFASQECPTADFRRGACHDATKCDQATLSSLHL